MFPVGMPILFNSLVDIGIGCARITAFFGLSALGSAYGIFCDSPLTPVFQTLLEACHDARNTLAGILPVISSTATSQGGNVLASSS